MIGNIPVRDGETVHMAFAGLFMGHMFLIFVDVYLNWTEVCIMKSSTASATIGKMIGMFNIQSLPVILVSNFNSEVFKLFMNFNGLYLQFRIIHLMANLNLFLAHS